MSDPQHSDTESSDTPSRDTGTGAGDDQAAGAASTEQGQVSEVSGMDPAEAEQPISPGDATAGAPDGESGRPDEGAAGPNAIPNEHQGQSN